MRIRWTEQAVHDLTQICDYLEEHDSAVTARRVALSVYERMSDAGEVPRTRTTGAQIGHSRACVHRLTVPCGLSHSRKCC